MTMNYQELERIFRTHEADRPKYHLDGLIVFSSLGMFEKAEFTQLDRTFLVSSNNKAYLPGSPGCSIFGSSLTEHDLRVRLERYMREPHAWIPGECGLIYYQLQCVNERNVLPSRIFPSRHQAIDAMMDDLCNHGELEYADVLSAFDRDGGSLEDNDFGVSRDSAWLNAGSTGNWDWTIQPIYVFDVTNIASGTLFFGPDHIEGAAGTETEQSDQNGGV